MTALTRKLSLFQAIGLSTSIIAPTAAMALNVSLKAQATGRAVPLAFAIGTAVMAIVGLSFVAFSRRIAHAGSVYAYDTNTMFIEFRHVSETEGVTPTWWADRDIMLPGQLAADSYETGQRTPGDYEAQVSQRPIAIHGLEHLGATDRGVSMFRNQIRRGVRAVKAGDEPPGLCRNANAVIPTYCNDTIVHVPPAETAVADLQLMRETGRRLAEAYLKDPPLMIRD